MQFADDAWPGEDRTFVVDEVGAALALAQQFAVEYDAEGAVVVVTGRPEFVQAVEELHPGLVTSADAPSSTSAEDVPFPVAVRTPAVQQVIPHDP